MALVTYLPSSDYQAMPWRNGAGVTHEIAIDDSSGESEAPFLWRLSMADLAGDGPFSEIADVDRILVLLEGEDVLLTIAGAAPEPLAEHEAIAFPGDVTTSLTMAPGSGRDLNLMWDRTRVQGMVDILNIGDTLQIELLDIPELSGTVSIGPDGTLYLPRLRALYVEGLTVEELRYFLTEQFKRYVRQPEIYIRPVGYRPIRIYVGGEVKRPGYYTLSGTQELGGVSSSANELEGRYAMAWAYNIWADTLA